MAEYTVAVEEVKEQKAKKERRCRKLRKQEGKINLRLNKKLLIFYIRVLKLFLDTCFVVN